MGFYFDANFVDSRLRAGFRRHHHHVRCPGCRQRHSTHRNQPSGGYHGILLRRRTSWITASCALPTAPSRRSILQGPRGTFVGGINPAGAITGSYFDASGVADSFVRAPNGTFIAPLDVPGSPGTFAAVINPAGVITGTYYDASDAQHGFLRIP